MGVEFLGLRNIFILRSTDSVTRYLFCNPFLHHFLRRRTNKEFRTTFEKLDFSQNATKLRGSTVGTVRTIIVAVRAR